MGLKSVRNDLRQELLLPHKAGSFPSFRSTAMCDYNRPIFKIALNVIVSTAVLVSVGLIEFQVCPPGPGLLPFNKGGNACIDFFPKNGFFQPIYCVLQ